MKAVWKKNWLCLKWIRQSSQTPLSSREWEWQCGNGNFQLANYRYGELSAVTSSFSTGRDILMTLGSLDSQNYLETYLFFSPPSHRKGEERGKEMFGCMPLCPFMICKESLKTFSFLSSFKMRKFSLCL